FGERKWHILLSIILMLITSSQCMDSKEVKQKGRRTLLDLILQVIGDSQSGDKPSVSRRYNSGLFPTAQEMRFSSGEKPLYVPRLDNSRPIEPIDSICHSKCARGRVVLQCLLRHYKIAYAN
uniref:Uncharacterized protein n=1 Tax=Oncorhynchus mykiss TaxID=8022 RepID=A0A8C7PX61_ONCMY